MFFESIAQPMGQRLLSLLLILAIAIVTSFDWITTDFRHPDVLVFRYTGSAPALVHFAEARPPLNTWSLSTASFSLSFTPSGDTDSPSSSLSAGTLSVSQSAGTTSGSVSAGSSSLSLSSSLSVSSSLSESGDTSSLSPSASEGSTSQSNSTAPTKTKTVRILSETPPAAETATLYMSKSATGSPASLTLSGTVSPTVSVTSTSSGSSSATSSQSASKSKVPPATFTHVLTRTKSFGVSDSVSYSLSTTLSGSVPPTTTAPLPTTTEPLTRTKTHITSCPDCGNGTCTTDIPFLCVCWKDTQRGFWLGGREEGEGCWDCLPAYYGATCLEVCPGGRCSPCSLHGECDNGVNGKGTCSCYADDVNGNWTGAKCSLCNTGFFGADCTGKCNCNDHGACFDGVTGNGTCACKTGYAAPYCASCAAGYGGKSVDGALNCTKCPGEPYCNGRGSCDADTGTCICNGGWIGTQCEQPCSDSECGSPCSNGGYLYDGVCVCPAEYRGDTCLHACPLDAFGSVCGGRGTCVYSEATNATCECFFNSTVGFWGSDNCTSCASSHLSLADNCTAECPFDTSGCPEGYQGLNCSVRCGGAPLSVTANCSGHGNCTCQGTCYCDGGYGGSYCQTACPTYGGLVCGGPGRGICYDRTGNGTCKCNSSYVGTACEALCDCVSPAVGACTSTSNPGKCVCGDRRAGTGCGSCAPGYRGSNCTTLCVNGTTNGTQCSCSPTYGGIGCSLQCASSGGVLCSGNGYCSEGEPGLGACVCNTGYFGPSCNCTYALCHAQRPNGQVTCDNDGMCVCASGFGGTDCSSCESDLFWGSACNELCSCVQGTCDRESGACTCYQDPVNGYWSGDECDECLTGYLPSECKLLSSLNPQITSLQASAVTTGRSYTANRIYYDTFTDSVFVTGQLFVRFDGSIDASSRNISKNTSYMLTGCSSIIGAFPSASSNNTRMHIVVNCFPITSSLQRIEFIAASTSYPNPFTVVPESTDTLITTSMQRPTVPIPRFMISMTTVEVLSTDCFLSFRRSKPTQFGQVNGDADYGQPNKTKYVTNKEIQCLIFKSQVTDGSSGTLLKLACVPIDPPLSPNSDPAAYPYFTRAEFFTAPLGRTDATDGYSGDTYGVAMFYSAELDGILIGVVTDASLCTIHFLPGAFNTTTYIRLYRSKDCKRVSAIYVQDGYVYAAIRHCEDSACSVQRATVIKFRPNTLVSLEDNPPITYLSVEPLLVTDYIVSLSFDTVTSTLVVTGRTEDNYYKILRILTSSSDYTTIGLQTSASPDTRGIADALVIPEKRVYLLLHKNVVGVALRRYILIEASSIVPEISDRRGGTTITVTGRGFVDGLGKTYCKIGSFTVEGTIVDSSTILCVSPIATGTSCTADTVDVSIFNSVFTVNRLSLRRIDYPKLKSATPVLQHFRAPSKVIIETTRSDESNYTKCKYIAISRNTTTGIVIFNGSLVTNGSALNQDGKLIIMCEPPPKLNGSTLSYLDVALDGTVFSGVSYSELPYISYLGDPSALVSTPTDIVLSSAAEAKLPEFIAKIVDVSSIVFGTEFEDVVQFFVTPVLPPPLPDNSSITVGQVDGVPAASLSSFLNAGPVISSGSDKGFGIFSRTSGGNPPVTMVNPVQGVVYLVVNLTSVFLTTSYPWSTYFVVTVYPGSIQKLVITREPGDTLTADGLVNDVEIQIQDGAGNIILNANEVVIGAAVVERFTLGDASLIPSFITAANPERVNAASEATVVSSGTAVFKSLRLSTRGSFAYSLRFYISSINESTAFPSYGTSNSVDPVNLTATATSIEMSPSCNTGDVRTIGSYTCETCLSNADCSDGSVIMLPGFWRSSAYASETFACTPAEACLGGYTSGVCSVGYQGPLCAVCSEGYGKSAVQGECEECYGTPVLIFLFVLLCLGFTFVTGLIVVLAAQTWRRQSVTLTLLQIFIDHMQTIALIGTLEFGYPQFFLKVITYCGLFTLQLLDFSVSDCIVRQAGDYFTKFFVYAAMAVASFFTAAVAWMILFIFPRIFRPDLTDRRRERKVKDWSAEVQSPNEALDGDGERLQLQHGTTEDTSEAAAEKREKARQKIEAAKSSVRGILLNFLRAEEIDVETARALRGNESSDSEPDADEEARDPFGKKLPPASLASLAVKNSIPSHRRHKDPSVLLKHHSYRLLSGYSLQVIMFFTLPSIVYYSLNMLNCLKITDPYLGNSASMNADRSISCDGDTYTNMYNAGIAVAVIYLVLCPLAYLYLYWRSLLYYPRHVKNRAQLFSFTMMGIKNSQWFWPAVMLTKKGVLAVVVVLLSNPIDSQVLLWILVLYLIAHTHIWPYLSDRVNRVEMICLLAEIIGLCTCNLLDMIDDSIGVQFIAGFGLAILLGIAVLVLVFTAHRTFDALVLSFRTNVLGHNLTESQSTDSEHLEALANYRAGRTDDHIPLPPGFEEDGHQAIFVAEGEHSNQLPDDDKSGIIQHGDKQSAASGATGSGTGSALTSPLLLRTAKEGVGSSDVGSAHTPYSPPEAVAPQQSEALYISHKREKSGHNSTLSGSQAPPSNQLLLPIVSAPPASLKERTPKPFSVASDMRTNNFDAKKDNKRFGIDVEMLQLDQHFNTNYPTRQSNMADANAAESKSTTTTTDSGDRRASPNDTPPVEPGFTALMPHSSAAESRRRRGRRRGEDEEEEIAYNNIGEREATEGVVPAFSSYSSKMSEALLVAQQRHDAEQRARIEEGHRQAVRNAGRRTGYQLTDSTLANTNPQGETSGRQSGAARAPGFLGEDAVNAVNYSAILKRAKRGQDNRNSHAEDNSDEERDRFWSERRR